MDVMYRGAAVTLVATIGYDSNNVLPGPQPGPISLEPLQDRRARWLHVLSNIDILIVSGSKW